MSKYLRNLALGIFLSVSPFSQTAAITYGEADGGQHPYVGLALFFSGGFPVTACSGTLIAPTVFLTAAHCTYGMDVAFVWFDEVVHRDPPLLPFITGTPIPHPNFDNFATFPNTSDIGVVMLHAEVNMGTYGELPALGALDSLATRRGQQDRLFTVVGYGLDVLTPLSPLTPPEFIERRKATSMLVNLRSALTDGYNLQTSNHPGNGQGTGGTCLGDSGGPILLGDTNIVVAVTSFGLNELCRGVGFNYRTDIQNSQDFIDSFINGD